MELSGELEEKIKQIAISYLARGKPNWDVPHTLRAVYWMKELIKREGGNEKVLVTAMYFHDIGYPQLQVGYDFDDLIRSKENHAINGAELAKRILGDIRDYSNSEIEEICALIKNHDNKEKFVELSLDKDLLHQILVLESDGLSKIDWYNVTPNFDKENTRRYLEYYEKRTLPCFKTQTGKEYSSKLIIKAKEYLDRMGD